jgi:hypothetical protein
MKNTINLKAKIVNKLFKSGYGFHNYPQNLKYIKVLNSKKIKEYIYKNFYSKDKNYPKKISINLSSVTIKKTPLLFWKSIADLKDIEDQACAHRWIWAYELLNNEVYNKKEKFNAINSLINNWFYYFGDKEINKKNIINESYTISERLANYVILSKLGFIKKNNLHLNSLNKQLEYLSENLEFYYKKKSNHLLNNIRSIIIYSNFTKQTQYLNFANKILNKLIFDFIDKDGFFKFGSSHYQFIFTKWMLDIFLFANTSKSFKSFFLLTLNACNFFIIKNGNKITIPLFGNVSPDISPKLIINLIHGIINKKNEKNNRKVFFNQYLNFFLKKKININIENINNNPEWKKIENKKIIVYARNPEVNGFNFNHSHNDYFHFVLFYKKRPIIIDSGRKSYLKKDEIYKFSEFHNSFLINEKNILDKAVNANKLKNLLLGIDFKYNIKNFANSLSMTCVNKFFFFKRSISIGNSWVSINNNLKMHNKSNVSFRLHIDNKVGLKKIGKECGIVIKKKLSFIKFKTNQRLILKTISLNKINNFEKYGDKIKHQLINLSFKNVSALNMEIKITF